MASSSQAMNKFFSKKAKSKEELKSQLTVAIIYDQEEIALALLKNPKIQLGIPCPTDTGCVSFLALSLMVPKPNKRIIGKLLELGADPDELIDDSANRAIYPHLPEFLAWQMAAILGHKEIVEIFIEKCADKLTLKTQDDLNIIDYLDPQNNPNIQKIYRKTLAAMNQKLKSISGVDPITFEMHMTALLEAMEKQTQSKSEEERQSYKLNIQQIIEQAEPSIAEFLICARDDDATRLRFQWAIPCLSSLRKLFGCASELHLDIANLIKEKLTASYTQTSQSPR